MNRTHLFAAVLATSCLLGPACASQKPASEPTFADDPQGGTVPITAKWSIPKVEGGDTHIAVRIKHLMAVPVEVKILVPEGVEVVSGRTAFSIPADGPKSVVEPLVLRGTLADTAELVVQADAGGTDFGIHGKDVYRVKPKAEPKPNEAGPEINVGAKNLGKAVPMGKPDGAQ